MILSVGLSPAWQRTLLFDRLTPGEVNRAHEEYWCTAGKVINAGLAVVRLGEVGRTLAPGGGAPLPLMDAELKSLGADVRWIETAVATRICTTLLDRSTGETTELVVECQPMSDEELGAYRRAMAEEASSADIVIISGSMPPTTPIGFYHTLLEEVARAKSSPAVLPVILDFRGPALSECLPLKPLVVKPNREELSQTVGRELPSERAILDAMRELCGRGAQWVVVTDGAGPVRVIGREDCFRAIPPRPASLVNPIGSGDSLTAGLAVGLAEGRSMHDAARLGIAAAVDNVARLFPARIEREEVERLVDEVVIEEY